MQGLREDKLSYLPLVLAVPVVAVILIVATSGGPSLAESKSFSSAEKSAIKRTENLLAGIPQHGTALGKPKAPVTLQFFGDLQCIDSRRVMLGALPFLIRHWVRGGELRIVYRSTETDTHDPAEFRGQQIAALAAGQQEKMWTFIDLFYREQRREFTNYANDDYLEGIAEQTGVNLRGWAEDRESDGWAREIESDEALAWSKELPGRSTPSFLIGPTGGTARPLLHFSLEESKVFDEAIRGEL
jgi:hypothetical protein